MKKKLFFGLVFLMLLTAGFVFAFEVNYPEIPGAPLPTDFPSLFGYFYHFSLILGTAICVISLIIGGVLYLVSFGNPGKVFSAKEQIVAALWGLFLLLGSFLIFNIANPQLLAFRMPMLSRDFPPLTDLPSPAPLVQVLWELPLGKIQESVMAKMKEVVAPSKEVAVFKVADLSRKIDELKNLLGHCQCSNLKTNCSSPACGPLACLAQDGGPATKNDLCAGRANEIATKRAEIEAKINELKVVRRAMLVKKVALEKEAARLLATKQLIKECFAAPIGRDVFSQLKDEMDIQLKKVWEEIDIDNNYLTFYCDIDEDRVQTVVNTWKEFAADLESQLGLEPEDVIEPPLSSPVCGNYVCEIGEDSANCSQDCLSQPPGTESFPFNWPMNNPYVVQEYGANPAIYGPNGHNGMDIYSSSGNLNIYAPAQGRVIGTNNMSSGCQGKTCADGSVVGFGYGVWLAIEHQVFYQNREVRTVTLYAHLRENLVSENQEVSRGQLIAIMDSTGWSCGAHLHFGLYLANFYLGQASCNDSVVYPRGTTINPRPFLRP